MLIILSEIRKTIFLLSEFVSSFQKVFVLSVGALTLLQYLKFLQ